MQNKPQKSITKFHETCDGPNSFCKWLGISRLSRIPDAGWPLRSDCQKAVTAEEKAAGVKLVADYRAAEAEAIAHDADARQLEMDRLSLGTGGQHGHRRAELRKELDGCIRETFLFSQNRLSELRVEAEKLAKPIFERLVNEFDKELSAVALRREEELQQMGIPIYVDRQNDHGDHHKEYSVYADPIVTAWQCRRECVRHRSLNIDKDNSIACVQWLCTFETHTPFQWL